MKVIGLIIGDADARFNGLRYFFEGEVFIELDALNR